ncbi:MAG: DUF6695 family protein [Bacteroidota bacterium]|nr:DUF6695 family protein [Bacteroidota bacterium]
MQKDFIIVLAWPEGEVFGAGSWYDKIFASNGKYRVGHSAIILINNKTEEAHYFDFGRYHTPEGFGRVRDKETDPDITFPKIRIKEHKILKLEEFLIVVSQMKPTHGKGKLYASVVNKVDFKKAYFYAKKTQEKGMLKYGPFTQQGTNCSRFSASVIRKANPSFIKRLRLRFPFCISPSPKRNISIANNNYYIIENNQCTYIEKTQLKAYFSSIET